jgi:hypothetical protein
MMEQNSYNVNKLRLGTAIISLLLSIFTIYSDDLINNDGILYIETAEAFLHGGLADTIKLYNWPFFSICIAYIHQLTQAPLELSAYILNTIFFVLLTDTLVLISKKILPNKEQLLIAVLIILCFATLNDYRNFIIRDIGYWYFCSLALYRFMQFLDLPSLRNAALWQLTAITAILFRIEGIVILLGLPFFVFFSEPFKKALTHLLKLNYLLLLGTVIVSIFTISFSGINNSFTKISNLLAYLDFNLLFAQFNEKAVIVENQVLNKYSASYSTFILASGLIVMLFYKLTKAVTVGYLGLYIFSSWKQRLAQLSPYKNLLIYFFLLNILLLTVFMFKELFISKRYTIIALLSMLLLMLPRITQLIQQAWIKRNHVLLTVAALILLVNFVDSLHKSNSKLYVKNTAIWASQNLDDRSTVLTDDEYIHYYYRTHQKNNGNLTRINIGSYNHKNKRYKTDRLKSSYQHYDYLIVVEKRRNKVLQNLLPTMQLEQIYGENNSRGDKASVYKVMAIAK